MDALAILSNEGREGVDARALHEALGGTPDHFTRWIESAVKAFDLAQGRDFEVFATDGGNPQGGRPRTDYSLSIGAAELIALSTKGEAALAARRRLLEIKEAWNSPTAVMARAVVMANAELSRLKVENAALRPKAELSDRLSAARGDVSLTDAARILELPARTFLRQLEADRILFRGAQNALEPYADQRDYGRFRVRVVPVQIDDDGRTETRLQTLVTPTGLQWLARRYAPGRAAAGGPRLLAS